MVKAVVDDINSVDEGLRDHYRQDDSGKYILNVEPVNGYGLEDVSGLKSALQKERSTARAALEKIQAYGDIDPEAARQALNEIETLRNESGNLDEKVSKLAQSKIDQIVSKHQKELESKEGITKTYRQKLEKVMLDNTFENAIRKAGGDERTVELLRPHFRDRAKLREINGDFIVDVVDPITGDPRVGSSDGSPMTIDQLVGELKASDTFASAFPSTGRSGGGTPSSGRRGGSNIPKKKSDFSSAQRSDFIEEHGAMAWIKLPD